MTSPEASMMEALDHIGFALIKRGLTLDEMIESGRDVRSKIAEH